MLLKGLSTMNLLKVNLIKLKSILMLLSILKIRPF